MGYRGDLTILSPGANAFNITPSNDDFITKTRGIYISASANLHVIMAGGEEVTFIGLAGGVVHPLQIIKVFSTGTNAGGIIGIV